MREQRSLELRRQIQKPPLIAQSDRLRFIQARHAAQPEIGLIQFAEGRSKQRFTIPDIRSQPEINNRQNSSGWRSRPPERRGILKYSYAPAVAMRPRGERCRKPS